MKVMKFGGSSIATVEVIKKTADIIIKSVKNTPIFVVVSAFGGVTNRLIELIEKSLNKDGYNEGDVDALYQHHLSILNKVVTRELDQLALNVLEKEVKKLKQLLNGISMIAECPARTKDQILSCGEKISQAIISDVLRSRGEVVSLIDAQNLIRTNDHFGNARVDFNKTSQNINKHLVSLDENTISIAAGFLGATADGHITTLGRDGSDYSAAILGAILKAKVVEIWSDVDGVFSADPGLINTVQLLKEIHYNEAAELAFFGAKVLHPKSILPLQRDNIPVVMKNTLNPSGSGTFIHKNLPDTDGFVKVVSSVSQVTFFKFSTHKPRQSANLAQRLFSILDRLEIQPLLVNQSSSDAAILIAIHNKSALEFEHAVHDDFSDEIENYNQNPLKLIAQCGLVALIGCKITQNFNVLNKLFSTLENIDSSVYAISYGVSGNNISFLTDIDKTQKILKRLHKVFIDSKELVTQQKSYSKSA